MNTRLKIIMLSIALALCAAWLWLNRYEYRPTPSANHVNRINRITGQVEQIKATWKSTTTTTQPNRLDVDEHGFWIPPTEK